MIFLGIDPGTRRIGYGIVQSERGRATSGENTSSSIIKFVAAGILTIKSTDDANALVETKWGVDMLIKKYNPVALGIEKLYFAKNQKTAIAVAQARGVILLAARESGVPICEYTPNEVKLGVTGYGFADKKAVLKMVCLILNKHSMKVIDDASDALALAIMASNSRRGQHLDSD